jgi:hypothetical protein
LAGENLGMIMLLKRKIILVFPAKNENNSELEEGECSIICYMGGSYREEDCYSYP